MMKTSMVTMITTGSNATTNGSTALALDAGTAS